MRRHVFSVLRKIIGGILIALGIVGAFIPIPLVPFFLLTVAGLGLVGVKPEIINKVKSRADVLIGKFFKYKKP